MIMNAKQRRLLLVLIMAIIIVLVEAITIGILYRAALKEEGLRLMEMAKSQARMIEAVMRHEKAHESMHPEGAEAAALDQIMDAHSRYEGFGKTGEFTLSKKQHDQIVFVLNHRHYDLNKPRPVPWASNLAEPMRRALSGQSGTVVGLDYRGVKVLAAHEPVREMNYGIVSKIDLSEVRAPFIEAGLLSACMAVVLIILGAGLFIKVVNPVIANLNNTVTSLEKALGEVKTLRGILPICSFCKKIRDDKGYWGQVEEYVAQHTDADFSHSICPECMAKHYPEIDTSDLTDRSTP